jgi:hypothetical protein
MKYTKDKYGTKITAETIGKADFILMELAKYFSK